jgi:hypothetical protein
MHEFRMAAGASVYKQVIAPCGRNRMRWPVLGAIATACVLIAGILFGWAAVSGVEEGAEWRIRDLRFLKSTHDRLQAELDQHAGDGVEASLRRGQQALLQSMAAIAQEMPDDRIPSDVKPLLVPMPAAPKADEPAAAPQVSFETAPAGRPADLRTGLDVWRVPEPDLGGLAVPADLRAAFERPRARRKPKSEKSATAGKPAAREKPAAGERPTAVEKPAPGEKPAAIAAAKE